MKKYLTILLLSYFLTNDYQNFGSFIFNSNSSESISMCDATVSWIEGANSISNNPAGLSSLGYNNILDGKFNSGLINGISMEFGSSMETLNVNSYNDTQFPYISIGWGMGLKNIPDLFFGFGFGYQSLMVGSVEAWSENEEFLSYFNYSESAISAALSIEYSPVRIGLKWINFIQNVEVDGQLNNFNDMKDKYFMPSEFGLQYSINKFWKLGLLISKSSKLGLYDMTISRAKIGLSTKIYNSTNKDKYHLLAVDFEKLSNDYGNVKIGWQHNLNNIILLRAGLRSELFQENDEWDIVNNILGSLGISVKVFDSKIGKSILLNLGIKQHVYPSIMEPLSRTMYFSISYKDL